MFALEVEYLTGRAVATERHDRERAEWPPHPGRLFSALVDGAFQGLSADGSDLPADVRAALEWLEALPPPALSAGEAARRDVVPVFVPVNDPKESLAVLPDGRGKQPRFFPAVTPAVPVVHFVWRDAPGVEAHRPALERLAACVTYLGHSSSLVRVAVAEAAPPADYEPGPEGRHAFRVAARGRLRELLAHFRRGARPSPGLYATYRKVGEAKPEAPAAPAPVFGEVIVCEIDGPQLPLSGAVKLTAAVREALIVQAEEGADPAVKEAVKSLLSGHTPEGNPSREAHVAYVPLANVGHHYADGRVMGFGVVLPRRLGRYSAERRAVLQAVAGLERVWFAGPTGTRYSWIVRLPTAGDVPKSLQPWAYAEPSRTWATVTPILCDRHPKEKRGETLEDIVAASVERVAGVRPVAVEVGKVSPIRGVPPSHEFDARRKAGLPPRHRVHAEIAFDRVVRGPLLAGAGRYAGLGLFRAFTRDGPR